jgi:hypothetical protein
MESARAGDDDEELLSAGVCAVERLQAVTDCCTLRIFRTAASTRSSVSLSNEGTTIAVVAIGNRDVRAVA